MAGVRIGSRKLLVILAFLLLNSYSITYTKVPLPETVLHRDDGPSRNGDVTMLVDSSTGQCLGAHGSFSECGELSLWFHRKIGGRDELQFVSAATDATGVVPSVSGECLGRTRSALGGTEVRLMPCHRAATAWSFDELSGKLMDAGWRSKLLGTLCVGNGNDGNSILQTCRKGFSTLRKVVLHSSVAKPLSGGYIAGTGGEESSFTDSGTWKCPVTGQTFPRNLDQHLSRKSNVGSARGGTLSGTRGGSNIGSTAVTPTTGGRQVFMGAGVFSKVRVMVNDDLGCSNVVPLIATHRFLWV
jgi:hypothetical protein